MARVERSQSGYGVATGTPAVRIRVDATDADLDRAPVLKTGYRRLDGVGGSVGKVKAAISVDSEGRVAEVHVLETTTERCSEMAVHELRRCLFIPARRNGIAVPCRVECVVEFTDADDASG